MMWEHLGHIYNTPTTHTWRDCRGNTLISARPAAVQTRAEAHNGRPCSTPPQRTRAWRTLPCASQSVDIRMPKQHRKSPRGCRERAVAASRNDAVLQRRSEPHFEVEPLLPTCAQGWQNEHGGTQGGHGDQPGVMGAAAHRYLESRWLCMGR